MEKAPKYYDFLHSKLDRICTDTRILKHGDIYLALKGERFDGNDFVEAALEKGASYAISDTSELESDQVLIVNNTYDYLVELGLFHRNQMKAKIIALTGSNGKTTTKELLYHIFKTQFVTIATQGNFNNHLGVPLTLLKLKPEHEFLILEMGANKPGDIAELCRFSDPDYGLITNIGKAHLEGFGSEEGVLRTKTELFNYLSAQDKLMFINFDSKQLRLISSKYKRYLSYGSQDGNADYRFELVSELPQLKIKLCGQLNYIFYSKLFGLHNFENSMAAISVAKYFGVSNLHIQDGLEGYHPTNMRSQITNYHSNTIVLDAYNANPSSMFHSILSFVQFEQQPKWVILGEMAELGKYSFQEHNNLVQMLTAYSLNKIILVGNEFAFAKNVGQNVVWFENVVHCKKWLTDHLPENHLILIKGSRSVGLEKLLID